jgi:glutaryl-CoA dehydrogenase
MAAFDALDPLSLDDSLTTEEIAVRDSVRSMLTQHVQPHVAEWFENGGAPNPRELFREFGKLGLLGMHLEGYTLPGMSSVDYGLACAELEACDSGIRSMVSVQGSLAMYAIWRWASEDEKQRWLPGMGTGELVGCFGLTEPDHGSDPGTMRTTARRDTSTGGGQGADWIIDGSKMWISNGVFADVAVIWAQTDEGIRGFAVPTDTPGFTAREIKHKMSLRVSSTAELLLEGVRVPATAMFPEVRGLKGPLSCLTEARYGIVWGSMGAARSSFETALEYSRSRVQFGRPIGGFQLTQAKLADMCLELHKGMLLALHLGRRKDSVGLANEQVSFGKLNNVREALEICRTSRTILGANGISLEYPVIRHMNNLESVLTYEGTVEMHTLILGQALTGQNAFS